MKPFFITVDNGVILMIVPDSDAHLDGHPVITYSYSIYKGYSNNTAVVDADKLLQPDKKKNSDYLGTIVFEAPGKLFNYVPDGLSRLDENNIQEVIELISDYRDKPQLWNYNNQY